jgi:3-isopropylmalate dehydratase small subunit
VIRRHNQETIPFTVDEFRKECLLNGLDDISLTLQKAEQIGDFERQQQESLPWLWANR